jgi:hypothetical protein
MLLFWTAVIYS